MDDLSNVLGIDTFKVLVETIGFGWAASLIIDDIGVLVLAYFPKVDIFTSDSISPVYKGGLAIVSVSRRVVYSVTNY